jgi:DNA end-binding protein Ku
MPGGFVSSHKPITAKARSRGENVVDLMEALKRSISAEREKAAQGFGWTKRNADAYRGKKPAKEAAKKTSKPQRRSA